METTNETKTRTNETVEQAIRRSAKEAKAALNDVNVLLGNLSEEKHPNWATVGTIAHIREHLRELLGEDDFTAADIWTTEQQGV